MVKKSSIDRGEKWTKVRNLAVFEKRTKDVEWLDSQPAIVEDIKNYEESIRPVAKEETKSKGKK